MNVLITGSSGSVGQQLLRALSSDPRFSSVTGMDIREPDAPMSQFIKADITQPMGSVLRARGIHAVVHAAFAVRPLRDGAQMRRVNVEGSANVLAACAAAGVRLLVHLSSATVYGFHAHPSQAYTEDSPPRPAPGFMYAEQKWAVEQLLAKHSAGGALPAVLILRPSFLVTPRSGNLLLEYLDQPAPLLPHGAAAMQFTHIEDLVEIIRLLLLRGGPGVYNIGAQGSLDVFRMARRLGRTPVAAPAWLLKPINALAWRCRVSAAPAPWAMQLLRHSWIVSSQRLIEATGYRFRYTTASTFEDFAAHRLHRRRAEAGPAAC